MYEYILYSYIGVLIIVLIKGYKNFYLDDNSTIKYTLFNDTNNLNTFLINENGINSKKNNIVKRISINKEFINNLKKNIDDRINTLITTIKNKFKKKNNNFARKIFCLVFTYNLYKLYFIFTIFKYIWKKK